MNDSQTSKIREFFDREYRKFQRYWWMGENRYSTDPKDHVPFHARLLELIRQKPPGRALDIGAGEGADAIRLAKLGFSVDALELSSVAAEKIAQFGRAEGVKINIIITDAMEFDFRSKYDIILCNGVLHYILDKQTLLTRMQNYTAPDGLNVVSLFTDATPIPEYHLTIPVMPDCEHGMVWLAYKDWKQEFLQFERNKPEASHPGLEPHHHSFIKMIVRKP